MRGRAPGPPDGGCPGRIRSSHTNGGGTGGRVHLYTPWRTGGHGGGSEQADTNTADGRRQTADERQFLSG